MNDRELLELAAKAAGLTIVGSIPSILHDDDWLETTDNGPDMFWNPLQNDGDALRLAVGLKIEVRFGGVSTSIPANVAVSYPKQISSASERKITLVERYVPDEMFTNTDSCFGESDRRFAEYYVQNYGTTVGVMAATRRAIVRAAAEIGRNMK